MSNKSEYSALTASYEPSPASIHAGRKYHRPTEGTHMFVSAPIPDTQIKDKLVFDLIVCGAGIAGLTTALSAAEMGLKVLVLEKREECSTRGSEIGTIGSRLLQDVDIRFDKTQYLYTALRSANYRCNRKLYEKIIQCNGEAVDWLVEQTGLNAYIFLPDGMPGKAQEIVDDVIEWNDRLRFKEGRLNILGKRLYSRAVEHGASFMFNTPACQLTTDEDGHISGVIAKNSAGEYIHIRGRLGVALCTGGYENNWDMLQKYLLPDDLAVSAWLLNLFTTENTGDGILMGQAVGGQIDGYPHVLMTEWGAVTSTHSWSTAIRRPWMRVNKQGKRFINEMQTKSFVTNACMHQTGNVDYVIFAGKNLRQIFGECGICDDSYAPFTPEKLEKAMIKLAVRADSIQELASLTGIDPVGLSETLANAQRVYESGAPDEFGNFIVAGMPWNEGPYYAIEEGGLGIVTVSGLKVDEFSRVLNSSGSPIPGLFAVGNCSGDMFYGYYPHEMNGLSHSRCVTFGYCLGRYLAKQ